MNSPKSEQDLVAALRRLAQDAEVPPPDPGLERALFAAFDAAWEQPRLVPARSRSWPAAAARVALAAAIAWMIAPGPARAPARTRAAVAPFAGRVETLVPSSAPAVMLEARAVAKAIRPHQPPDHTPRVASRSATEFVVWPGAAGLPTFESGHLIRVAMPAPVVLSLGLVPPMSQTAVVQADVLVGQDGLPRAVRLAP
jgi:hypothetical protein